MEGAEGEVGRGQSAVAMMAERAIERVGALRSGGDLGFVGKGGNLLCFRDPRGDITDLGAGVLGKIHFLEKPLVIAPAGVNE